MENKTDIQGLIERADAWESLESLGSNWLHAATATKLIRDLKAALQQWMPIETAPLGEHGKPETYFLGMRPDGQRLNTATCYRNKHGAYEWWGGGLTPTYWMPIPAFKVQSDNKQGE